MTPTDSEPNPAAHIDNANVAEPGDQHLGKLLDATLLTMANMAEPGEAGHHIQRIQLYVQALARQLGNTASYAAGWNESVIDVMVRACVLHDIGNSAVPDRILLKPGALTPDELEVIRTHPVIGRDLIDQIQRTANVSTLFLDMARQITHGHHERWDGLGYPQGLDGEHNPAPARLMAIADAYDALTSDRVYRAGVAHDKAVQLIFQERGGQFAPDMVDAFIEVQHDFQQTAERLADTETDFQKKIDYMAKAIAESP
mgnify:CR=1 FL=1